jgi:hypothetical protein
LPLLILDRFTIVYVANCFEYELNTPTVARCSIDSSVWPPMRISANYVYPAPLHLSTHLGRTALNDINTCQFQVDLFPPGQPPFGGELLTGSDQFRKASGLAWQMTLLFSTVPFVGRYVMPCNRCSGMEPARPRLVDATVHAANTCSSRVANHRSMFVCNMPCLAFPVLLIPLCQTHP